MAWSSLASNQMVNQDDAVSSPFSLNSGQSHGSGTQCFTKDAALTKYNLDASAMSSYASNQLVPKQVWQSGVAPCTLRRYELISSFDGAAFNIITSCGGAIENYSMSGFDEASLCLAAVPTLIGGSATINDLGPC